MPPGSSYTGHCMRIITANLNGIRSAASKGFFDWMKRQRADVVCLQELKAKAFQLDSATFHPRNYHVFLHEAQRPGYSGVAIYSRHQPDNVVMGLGWPDFDAEGRYVQADYGELSVVSLYLPSGSSGPERQAVKFGVLERLLPHLRSLRRRRRKYILCGDWNIAHKAIDLKNWRSNQKNSGFLPEERAWFDQLLGPVGFVDAFRQVNTEPDQYTWWSNRGRARDKNVGWRIDYQIISPALKECVRRAAIYKGAWFSDHAPLTIDYDYPLPGAD